MFQFSNLLTSHALYVCHLRYLLKNLLSDQSRELNRDILARKFKSESFVHRQYNKLEYYKWSV